MENAPNLSISPEKVFFIISKARQSDIESSEPDLLSDLTDDDADNGGSGRTTDRAELAGFIKDLNVDEQIDLVALMWLGRGDAERDGLGELRQEAARTHTDRTATGLIETP